MTPLTDNQKLELQNTSWRNWCLDLLDRRFYNIDIATDRNYAILAFDEHPYVTVLYNKMFFIKCVLNEGYIT